jgi:O-antigen ligase
MPERPNKISANIIILNIILLMLSFYFFPMLSPLLTLLLGIFTLSLSRKIGQRFKRNFKWIFLFSAYFWVYLAGMIHTQNTDEGWNEVILKLSFLAYPIIFGLMEEAFIQRKQLWFLLGTFIGITTGSVLFSLIQAVQAYSEVGQAYVFFYAELSDLFHPSYYAFYISLSLAAVIYFLVHKSGSLPLVWKILLWLQIPLYIVFLILLQSKAGLIGLISLFVFTAFHLVFQHKDLGLLIRLSIMVLVSSGLTIALLPQSTSRVNQVVESMEKHEDAAEHSASAARIYLWEAALNAIKAQPLWGYGTGDVSDEMQHQYQLQNNHRAIESHYNPHNQYLQSAVAVGVFGLLSLLILFAFPAYTSFRNKNLLYFLFVMLMAINLLVESMFERQAGVMFYAFFNSFFFFFLKNGD